MSRLYLQAISDTRKNQINARGNQRIEAAIFWGSSNNPKEAAFILVDWPEGSSKPTVIVRAMGEELIKE